MMFDVDYRSLKQSNTGTKNFKQDFSLLIKIRDLSVCLSGYAFCRALFSHAEILDSDWGHIFRKYRRKNNKKVTLIYEKTVKTARFQGIWHRDLAKTLRAYGGVSPGC